MRKVSLGLVFCVAALVVLFGSNAVVNGSILVGGTVNELSMVNYENYIDTDSNGVFSVGDRLRGVFKVTNVAPSGYPEISTTTMTGIFDITAMHIIDEGLNTNGDRRWSVLFGPNGNLTAGSDSMLLLYEGSTDFATEVGKSVAEAEASATSGMLMGAYGMPGVSTTSPASDWGAQDHGYWYSSVTIPDGVPIPLVGSVTAGDVSFATGLISVGGALHSLGYDPLINEFIPLGDPANPTGTSIMDNSAFSGITKFDFVGEGEVFQNTDTFTNGHYAAKSDDPFRVSPLPEPTSLMIWSVFGLCIGVAAFRRRSRS